ncbi:MAG: amidohydrolase [Mycolicibacterium sp.]|uniref:amidohydrolase n=1 Tax=Mycolicibacterium sp. TaxID=2320850 RepID=UPI003D09BEBC
MCANCDLASALGGRSAASEAQAAARTAPQTHSDTTTVFRGGRVYTLNPQQPWAQALAVRGKNIVAVGSDDEVGAAVGPDARVIELAGRMVLPGFVEGHAHPLLGAFAASGVDLQVPTAEAALAAIAEYARVNPTGPVRGFGWRIDMFGPDGPHRKDLDAILPDRPAILFAIDMHSLWVNSKTLELAGITKNSPDPVPEFSFYTRDADGEPTGFVLEAPAILPTVDAVEPTTKALLTRLFAEWTVKATAAGITTVFDAGAPAVGDDPGGLTTIYTDLEAAGRLPFRVVASHIVKNSPVDNAVVETLQLSKVLDTELVKGGVLKILGDGTPDGYTAALLAPYSDRPDWCGETPFSAEEWRRLVVEADAAGLDVHVHACGDATVRLALDAFEAAITTNPARDRRHTIAHNVLIDEADLPRYGQLGVIGQFSANWHSADPSSTGTMTERYGPQRQGRQYQTRTILDHGGTISFGTDWPAAGWVSTYKPLDAIEVAVTRQLVGSPHAPVLEPSYERLNLEQALYANTMGAARQLRLDHLVGSLEPGKRADLVVLAKNLFDVPPHQIASTPVEMTMMNGCFTHGG